MSMFRKRSRHRVPMLNTASLPDLIFTVLFFFMIVTHMRKTAVKVQYQVPQGTELTKLTKKSAVSYIYIGQPFPTTVDGARKQAQIQMNDKFVTAAEVADYVTADRNAMTPDDARAMTVSVKADRQTDMGTITDVKQALRQAHALRINYSAISSPEQPNRSAKLEK